MISAPNRRPPSSGNKWLVYGLLGLLLAACSPKIRQGTQTTTTLPPSQPAVKPQVVNNAPIKFKPIQIPVISMILPFELDKVDLTKTASRSNLSQADLAVDYYQGFKLALDSLTAKGYNFKLQVFDSRDDAAQAHSLAVNPQVRSSDLIVGPVFPESIKVFTASLTGINKPVISPLSPAPPMEFKDANLITITPPLEYHAWRAAQYIEDHIKPTKVFVLRSGYSEENKYILPFKKAIDSLGKHKVQVIYLTVSQGNLDALMPQLSASNTNVFIVPAIDQAFLTVTLRALDKLGQTYPVTVIGHPNWAKVSFLQAAMLQRFKTYITCTDNVDYKAVETQKFIKAYRSKFHLEPSEYAIKGFDEGYYLGTLLSTDTAAFSKLDKQSYDGLHNGFDFVKTPNGWVNKHVSIYQYQNFELKQVE